MSAVAAPVAGTYPVDVTFADTGLERSRVTVFFRSLIAIPILVVAWLYAIGFMVTTVLAWFAILFTGRYPAGLYSYGVGYQRLVTNVYAYIHFVTDEYPGWSGNDSTAASYPVQYSIVSPGESNRVTVFFRYILAIPAVIFGAIVGIAGYLAAVVAWFAIMITGKYPVGLLNFVEGTIRSIMRINSYYAFLTDEYPPFSVS